MTDFAWNAGADLRFDRLLESDPSANRVRLSGSGLRSVPRPSVSLACFGRVRGRLAEIGGAVSRRLRAIEGRPDAASESVRLWLVLGRADEAFLAARGGRCEPVTLAEALLAAGDADACLRRIDGLRTPEAVLLRIEALRSRGGLAAARREAGRALAARPRDPDLLCLSGRAGAPEDLARALAADPGHFWARILHAISARGAGRAPEAAAGLATIGAADGAWALALRALCRRDAGEPRWREDLLAAIDLDPSTVWAEAGGLGGTQDLAGIVRTCDARIASDAGDAWAWALRGEARDEHGLAVADLRAAIEREPATAWFHASLARILLYKGEAEAALAACDRASALAPKAAWIRAWRGEIQRRLGDQAGALASQDAVIAADPAYPRAPAWRGSLRLLRGDPEGALRDLDLALDLDASYAWAWGERSAARLALGDRAGARSDAAHAHRLDPRQGKGRAAAAPVRVPSAKKAVDRDPWQAASHAGLAVAAFRRGRFGIAAESLALFRLLSVKDAGACLFQAQCLRRNGDPSAAQALASDWLDLHPGDPWALQERSLARLWRGDLEGARRDQLDADALDAGLAWTFGVGRPLLARPRRNAWALAELDAPVRGLPEGRRRAWRARLASLAGLRKQAWKDLRAALAVAPVDPWTVGARLSMLLEEDRDGEALAVGEALKVAAAPAWVLALVGEAMARAGRVDEARIRFERAASGVRPELVALFGLARIVEAKEPGRALALLESAAVPRSAWCSAWKGRLQAALGHTKDALASFDDALGLHPGFAEAAAGRGRLRREAGDARAAVEDLRRALESDPTRADWLVELGLALVAAGEHAPACAAFAKAAEADPRYRELAAT